MIKKLQQSEGFTLIELMIVLLLIGVLALIIIPTINSSTADGKLNTLKTNISRLRKAIDLYYVQHNNTYPGVNKKDGKPANNENEAVEGFTKQLTLYTKLDGDVKNNKAPKHIFGPYVRGGLLLRNYKRFSRPKPKKRGPKPFYKPEAILKRLKKIWLASNLPCSKQTRT